MNTIYKYVLRLSHYQTITVDEDATFLSAKMQGGNLCVWVMHNPEGRQALWEIGVFGTGFEMEDMSKAVLIDTVQEEPFVWHVFLLNPKPTKEYCDRQETHSGREIGSEI